MPMKTDRGDGENTDVIWEAWINERRFTFRKARREGGAFLYNCVATRSSGETSVTSFFSDKDMTPDELEAFPRFIAFVSATR
jgi:hypothetical protein